MIGRSVASAMRLKCASAISGDWPRVNGAGGNTSSAEAPPSLRHARDPRRLEAAVGPDAVDERQPLADLVLGDVEHAPLLVEAAGGDLGRMRVDGDGGDALGRRHVAQVRAEALLVDREILVERQQHGRDDAVRNIGGVTGHLSSPGFVLWADGVRLRRNRSGRIARRAHRSPALGGWTALLFTGGERTLVG